MAVADKTRRIIGGFLFFDEKPGEWRSVADLAKYLNVNIRAARRVCHVLQQADFIAMQWSYGGHGGSSIGKVIRK